MPKTMTVRLSDEQALELEAVARIDEMPVSEAVRQAIEDRITARRKDKKFQERLQRHMRENQAALERLAS